MYKISVPIANSSLNENTREEYLRQFREAEVDRIFLFPSAQTRFGMVDDEIESLRQNLSFFKNNGIDCAIWVGNTIGHGGLAHDLPQKENDIPLSPLVNFLGEEMEGTCCPLNPTFQKNMRTVFRSFASTGAKLILIDDDFRLSQHTNGMSLKHEFCCLCDRHMEKIQALCGEKISREELRQKAFCGKPNRYRKAFLQAQGDSLREVARIIRETVDEVDPTINLALCTCYCHWGVDGATPLELTEILRGQNDGVLRLNAAPYWATRRRNVERLPFIFEIGRMFSAFSKGHGIETMDEGDCYPRPRDYTPSSYIELHDAVMRVNGTSDGNLKYMFDYLASPFYERGYVERHVRDLPALKALEQLFEGGEQVGVRVQIDPQLIHKIDCDLTPASDNCPYPVAGAILGLCAIPTTYEDEGQCRAVFGENLYSMPDAALDNGLILDAVSALLLTERGVDVGMVADDKLRSFIQGSLGMMANFTPVDLVQEEGQERAIVRNGSGSFFAGHLKESVTPVLYGALNGESVPLAYRYENADGQRFFVFLFNAATPEKSSDLYHGYLLQLALRDGIEWISRAPLPVSCTGNPDLYILCKRQGDALSVALFNCFADSILSPVLRLDDTYTNIRFVNTDGVLDGNTVRLREIPAFGFAAFCVEKTK